MTPTGYFLDHLWLIPLFPLATAALMLFFGRRLPNTGVSVLCVGSVGLSFVYAMGAVFQLLAADPEHRVFQKVLFEWLTPGPMQMTGGHAIRVVADWGYLLHPLDSPDRRDLGHHPVYLARFAERGRLFRNFAGAEVSRGCPRISLRRAGSDGHRAFTLHRSHGQIRTDSSLRLAPGRDGRPY